jgi:predicted thioredoxin/glutaredoxin
LSSHSLVIKDCFEGTIEEIDSTQTVRHLGRGVEQSHLSLSLIIRHQLHLLLDLEIVTTLWTSEGEMEGREKGEGEAEPSQTL